MNFLGDDYIFHCHPPDQKIPKPKRLQEWYKKMLDKGIIERIVLDYKDILKQATEDKLKSAAELPYFEGFNSFLFNLVQILIIFSSIQAISGQMLWRSLLRKSKWK